MEARLLVRSRAGEGSRDGLGESIFEDAAESTSFFVVIIGRCCTGTGGFRAGAAGLSAGAVVGEDELSAGSGFGGGFMDLSSILYAL